MNSEVSNSRGGNVRDGNTGRRTPCFVTRRIASTKLSMRCFAMEGSLGPLGAADTETTRTLRSSAIAPAFVCGLRLETGTGRRVEIRLVLLPT